MIQQIIYQCKQIKDGRTIMRPILKCQEELGELSTEVNIELGNLPKSKGGPDGIVGEAVDLIVSAVDVIVQHKSDITEKELLEIANKKLTKWKKSVDPLPLPRLVYARDAEREEWTEITLIADLSDNTDYDYPYLGTEDEDYEEMSNFDGYRYIKELNE